jgi:tetratricopeptide (TPR) repeat protein
MVEIPLPLRSAIESGRCVLFVGAGIGREARNSAGRTGPTADELSAELCQRFAIDQAGGASLATVSQIVELRKGRRELEAFLTARLASLEPDASLQWLATVPWRAIFTTNYDRLLQRSYELAPRPPRTPVTISSTAELVHYDPRFQVPVYHLHGSLFDTPHPRVLVTDDDYATFRERRRMLFELLKVEFASSTILYVGYRNEDPNWKMVLAELRQEFLPATPPVSYRLAPTTDPLERELLEAKGIHTIDATLADFVSVASSVLAPLQADATRLGAIESKVPASLRTAFGSSPAATARLLNEWTYVDAAPFGDAPNIRQFLMGEPPNWALVGQGIPFERDVEELILDHLLDYATAERPTRQSVAVLGPAGYGTSTVLMRTAARLVNERAGPVFMLRRGARVIEGDVVFACSLFPDQRPFFVVDNAGDWTAAIGQSIQALKNADLAVCFLVGERLNQWRQTHPKLRAQEVGLEALSEQEIDRLLQFLTTNHALNQLEPLDLDTRRAAIRSKHEKQLLVAMREATEGMAFDAIIEDEYRRLPDEMARRLYAAVSCGYHLRRYVRDGVLARVLGVAIEEMYEQTKHSTEGVVFYDCLDEARGHYGGRARHQTIAEIVWHRCVADGEREGLIMETLEALNLAFYPDVKLFEDFVREDEHVDSIPGLEGKIRFFEAACRKAPDDAYVIQHYARMLLRERRFEAARAQIDRALAIAPSLRVLHHTRGMVLRQMAMAAESTEIGRRFLVQAEQAFSEARNRGRRDPYPYQGLAELYLGWASRVGNDDERVAYIARAEEVVEEGLREVDGAEREFLWICSADVQNALGNVPERVRLLERAVSSSPGGAVARYLLARAYRDARELDSALEVLKPVIENFPNEYRASILYAAMLAEKGDDMAKCIAVLRLAELQGMRDTRYIATLGGMLFMNGDFSAAEKVFRESGKRSFAFSELNREEFVPKLPGGEWVGTISAVRSGYAFVRVPGYPDVFFPRSKFGRLRFSVGARVAFRPAFTARGPVVRGPRIVGRGAD